ncbi:MAG: hypothetical protein GY936_18710 [Ignavibacteriae bacterium]|nr:hypothetical protein [Ignavibacteriota bacterium]
MILYFFLIGFLSAQENSELKIQPTSHDTTKIENEQKYKLLLSPNLKSKSPLLSLGKTYDPFVETFEFIIPIYFEEGNKKTLSYSERQRIKNEINLAMKVYRDGKRKTDLGVFGQVLGYSQTAAVLGLAIYHIHKYGFK